MSGVQVDGSELVSGRSVVGSLNTWSVAISENTNVMIRAGVTIGILMRQAICASLAPSMRADSYSSDGIALSAVDSTIMLNPVPPHRAMLAIAMYTVFGPSRSTGW